jgi:hypothetical protein
MRRCDVMEMVGGGRSFEGAFEKGGRGLDRLREKGNCWGGWLA